MATCHGEMHDLCVQAVADDEDDNIILVRETDPALGSGPDVWVKTSRENFGAFADAVKRGDYDDLYPVAVKAEAVPAGV